MATAPSSTAVSAPTHGGKPTVIARLQGLFPTSPTTANAPDRSVPPRIDIPSPRTPLKTPKRPRRGSAAPRFLKIRILTWNMHDSVPKGNLEELFGKVPFYTPSSSQEAFPQFAADQTHPYHLVVVAGQECPTVSGIPMGLGAGFKLVDKDKEDKEKDLDRQRSSKHSNSNKEPETSSRSRKGHEESPHEGPPSGWTAMIENWLCYANSLNYVPSARATSPSTSDISIPKRLSSASRCTTNGKEPKKGPYQLLTKERLMGIYLAIYIHRDAKPFVRGTSKDAVTAGLIGGRVGNKGGVGITVNIDGTTLLFLNCHLAAHEGKVNHRLANLAKIKTELSVDAFLHPDDPRVVSEDLTDKFDYSFLFGDLNFRLDIKRLHADWLISRQDYAQALTFDQLKNLMASGQAFVGFNEGLIDFPPTFKYDVLRTIKDSKKTLNRWTSQERRHRLTEVQEKDLTDHEQDDKDSEGDAEGEATSVISSVWTSMHSRHPTEDDDDYFQSGTVAQQNTGTPTKISISATALKAKSKWLSLISPASPASPTKWLKSKQSLPEQSSPAKKRKPSSSLEIITTNEEIFPTPERSTSLDGAPMDRGLLQPPSLGAASSMKSSLAASEHEEGSLPDGDKGVYDSSHKKRVPSWCDRILFKSTVQPDPDPEDEGDEVAHGAPLRPRPRVVQFFANAFRPLSARSRRESITSSIMTPNYSPPGSPPDTTENVQPFSRFVYSSPPNDLPLHSKSKEAFVTLEKHPPSRSFSELDVHLRRSRSASSSSSKLLTSPAERRNRRSMTMGDTAQNTNDSQSQTPQSSPVPTPMRWRFLPSFLTHHHASSSANISMQPVASEPPAQPSPRKGDIICINYNTLDDRGMRRLEGRSDHRPVVGSYAVYI